MYQVFEILSYALVQIAQLHLLNHKMFWMLFDVFVKRRQLKKARLLVVTHTVLFTRIFLFSCSAHLPVNVNESLVWTPHHVPPDRRFLYRFHLLRVTNS